MPVAAKVERDCDVAMPALLERLDGRQRGEREEGARCSKSPSPRTISSLDSEPAPESPVTKTMRGGTHMKLFSPERANALIPKLAPLIEELWRSAANWPSGCSESIRRCNTPSRAAPAAGRRALAVPAAAIRRAQARNPPADPSDRIARLHRERHRPGIDRFPVDPRGTSRSICAGSSAKPRRCLLARHRRGVRDRTPVS